MLMTSSAGFRAPLRCLGLVIVFAVLGWNTLSATAHSNVLQGMFDSCAVAQDPIQCQDRLVQLGRSGFTLAINGGGIDPVHQGTTLAYAAAGHRAGIRQVWVLGAGWWDGYDPKGTNQLAAYPGWTTACGCQTNDQLLTYMIDHLHGPATAGYYLADDSALYGREAAVLPALVALNQRIHQLDPSAKTYVSNYALSGTSGSELAQYQGAADVVLQESYPVRSGSPGGLYDLRQQVGRTARAMANGKRAGLQTGAILQAWSWSDSLYDTSPTIFANQTTRFPKPRELAVMWNVTVRYRPSVVFWFTYTQVKGWPVGQELSYWRNVTPSVAASRWNRLQSVAFSASTK